MKSAESGLRAAATKARSTSERATENLSWKVEFAARWSAFDIRFEAHGKELTDSVRINDWISDNVLSFPHPYHVVYELFQDKSEERFRNRSEISFRLKSG